MESSTNISWALQLKCFILICASLGVVGLNAHRIVDVDCLALEGPMVFLTVSSTAKRSDGLLNDRMFEINWNQIKPEPGDWVGLFDHFPNDEGSNPLENETVVTSRGYVKTGFRFNRTPVRVTQDHCLGYWIAYVRNDRVILRNCFRIYPNWMNQSRARIGDIPLHSLMIPGTHNSGSWKEYDRESETFFVRYLVNQDESVYTQLVHGIRYLDLRVGAYPHSDEMFWINHNFYRMRPLSEIVKDVKTFVEETNEIIILDFHRFPVGFNGDGNHRRHAELVKYLFSELGRFAVPRSLWPDAKPNDIWAANKSIIISYSDAKTVHKYSYLWPALPQEWGDKRKLPELKRFLNDSIKSKAEKGQIYALMAEFTPKPLDIVIRPMRGLRSMAQSVNIPLSYWFLDDKMWISKSNIIATDFFLGNNIIETSIKSNNRRLLSCPNWP